MCYEFRQDFPDRLERFEEQTGLTWNSLPRRLGVNPYRLSEWRRRVVPDFTHLFILLTLAERLGHRGILMCPERDMDIDAGPNRVKRPGEQLTINGQILR